MSVHVSGVGIVLLCSLVYGCATRTPQQQAQFEADADRKIICTKGADCETKWGRAVAWISQNSHWKIQTQNEYLIQTYTSMGNSSDSSFTVNKVPIDNDTSEIVMSSGCPNMFGCIPDALFLKARFTNFLIGPAPTVSAPAPTNQKPTQPDDTR